MQMKESERLEELTSLVRAAYWEYQALDTLVFNYEHHHGRIQHPFFRAVRHLCFLKEFFEAFPGQSYEKNIDIKKYMGAIAVLMHRPPHTQMAILGRVTRFFYDVQRKTSPVKGAADIRVVTP